MFNPNNVTGIASVSAIQALGASAPLYPNLYLYPSNINYYWNPSSTATPDGVLVIQATGVTTGRYLAANTIFPSIPFYSGYKKDLTLSTAGSSGTFGITAGNATDTTNASLMALATAYTKTTAAWAVGTGNGSLDTGSIANNTWYSVFLIQRPDTGVTDILTSVNPGSPGTAPTLPTNYTLYRRIGSMLTDSSAHWVKFIQNGSKFVWAVPVPDYSAVTAGTTSAITLTLKVPTGVVVDALFNWVVQTENGGINWVSSLAQTDTAPFSNTVFTQINSIPGNWLSSALSITTNTSAQIRVRLNGTTDVYYVNTQGWIEYF